MEILKSLAKKTHIASLCATCELLVICVTGWLFKRALFGSSLHDGDKPSYNIWLDDIGELFLIGNGYFILCSLLAVALAFRGAWLIWRMFFKTGKVSAANQLEILLAGMVWAAILSPFPFRSHVNIDALRYSLPAFGVIFMWLAVPFLKTRRFDHLAVFSGTAIILAAIAVAMPKLGAVLDRLSTPLPLSKCLKTLDGNAVMSDYWNAKLTMLDTRGEIHMIQLTNGGEPYPWIYNRQWFFRHINTGQPLKPRHIVIDRINRQAIEARHGPPSSVTRCATHQILHYEHIKWPPENFE